MTLTPQTGIGGGREDEDDDDGALPDPDRPLRVEAVGRWNLQVAIAYAGLALMLSVAQGRPAAGVVNIYLAAVFLAWMAVRVPRVGIVVAGDELVIRDLWRTLRVRPSDVTAISVAGLPNPRFPYALAISRRGRRMAVRVLCVSGSGADVRSPDSQFTQVLQQMSALVAAAQQAGTPSVSALGAKGAERPAPPEPPSDRRPTEPPAGRHGPEPDRLTVVGLPGRTGPAVPGASQGPGRAGPADGSPDQSACGGPGRSRSGPRPARWNAGAEDGRALRSSLFAVDEDEE